MARQVTVAKEIEYLRYPSWWLCRLLDLIVGTKEEVTAKRKCDLMHQYATDMSQTHKILYSGSRGEGLAFSSSDADFMCVDRDTVVVESINNVEWVASSKSVLLMKRNGCSPGYLILRVLRTDDVSIKYSIVDFRGHPVVSSLIYRDAHRLKAYGEVGHGPCNTHHFLKDFDIAYCFQCDMWPTEANEFIFRQRPYGWPPKHLLDRIICRGCHLVPVGEKNVDLSHIQWRLSFSAAEKDLAHSFSHTQLLVYSLMKIFLKEFINKVQSVHDLLCSYFLKTAMFYCIETTPSSFWRDDLLIHCFWFCINKLIQWVKQGYCPNYFVPQNNMFQGKIFGENQRNLLRVLNQCKRFGWTCLCICEQLQPLRYFLNHPDYVRHIDLIPSANDLEYLLDFILLSEIQNANLSGDWLVRKIRGWANRGFARSLTLLCYSTTQQEENISKLVICCVQRSIGQAITVSVGINNKDKYRKMYYALLLSAKGNRYTGYVYLATFYHHTGQYRKAVHLCNRVISQWKPYVMYNATTGKISLTNRDMYKRYVCGRGVSIIDKAKSAYAHDIFVNFLVKTFFPTELLHDVDATSPFPLIVPPMPYTVFLSFLCHYKLGNIDETVGALHDLQVLINDDQQGCSNHPMLNMLAVCQDKLGDVQGAIDTCCHSLILKPDKNGTNVMLERLLSKYS